MHLEFCMGNEAIALGALAAGVRVAAGYPGTPSTEVLECVARRRGADTYVEWSVNEKAAMEVAAGAAMSGARALVTCKQVGLNVASDPLMSLSYVGVKGGLVVLVADDPGPISSQTEQDTRTFAQFAKVPVLDPSTPEEAYRMMGVAFCLSEREGCPVIVRPTTRVDHGYASLMVADEDEWESRAPEGFVRDPSRWVIFPRLSFQSHARIEARDARLAGELSRSPYDAYNYVRGTTLPSEDGVRRGIATHGISFCYVTDALGDEDDVAVLKVSTPYPFPEDLAVSFLSGLDEVLCVEELDPVIERALTQVAGKHHLDVRIRGKLTGDVAPSGENDVDGVRACLAAYLGLEGQERTSRTSPPELVTRPPVLCAGCPHRASFYAVKRALRGKRAVFCGDIGCYTLGNAHPLDMVDTCLCMGAGITMAQGIGRVDSETCCVAFVGDSTFFASGITGVVNAVFNKSDLLVCILDNSTTAMTGHQVHPGIGRTLSGEDTQPVSIEAVLRAIGLIFVECVNPLDHAAATDAVRRAVAEPGVKAIIFKSPCVVLAKPQARSVVDAARCVSCGRCIRELGCPALSKGADGKAVIDETQCTGCTLCEQLCPVSAISGGERL